jgi:hypothetical protein
MPFLSDLEVHARFLIALPLLLIAELGTERHFRPILQRFLERNLVPEQAMTQFDAAIKSAARLRNSVTAEVLLIAFIYAIGVTVLWRQYVALDTTTWYATPSGTGSSLSYAGIWYAYISLPVFQFLLCRWYFRLFIWGRLLWQISRIELNLVPTHPDRVGGLSFVSNTARVLSVFAAAHGALLAGYLSTRVIFLDTPLIQFKSEIALMVVFVLCLSLGPLLVFVGQLVRVKREGLNKYGSLATRYVKGFDDKWIGRSAPIQEELVGSADIQSLADIGNSYGMVRAMRMAPITKDAILVLTLATLAPLAPLLLTMTSLEELIRKLVGILLK